MARAAESVGSSVVDALWLDTLQRIVGRAAHEVKGALNGVSVNLEVVRSRAEKAGVPASAVGQFANAAVDQVGALIAMTEGVLSISRQAHEPVDLGLLLARFGALLVPAVKADGHSLALDDSLNELGVTSANGNAVRLAVGASLLAAVEQAGAVRCAAAASTGGPSIRLDSGDGVVLAVDQEIMTAAADAGIQIVAESSAIIISFPR